MIKDLFIDRKTILKSMTMGLKAGKDYVLIAPRRFGKTTLAHKVFEELRTDDKYLTISIDIMRYSGSVSSLAEGIVENCLNSLGFMGKLKLWLNQVDFSLKLKVSYGDLDIEPMFKLIRDKSNDFALLEYSLELLEKVALKTNKSLIVFFDEFGELDDLDPQVIKIFRSILQLHKKVNYIFAGSQETLMTKIFMDKGGAFYRFGDLIKVGNLDKDEVVEYLTGMNLKFDVINVILNHFECHPYYTSKIIKDLQVDSKRGESLGKFINYISDELIRQEMGYLELQLQKIKSRAHALDIIADIAIGLDPYSSKLAIPRQGIYTTLKNLELGGFIINIEKGKYRITDPLLSMYLSN